MSSKAMPRRSVPGELRMFSMVAAGLSVTISLLGTYTSATGAVTPSNKYKSPASRACFLIVTIALPRAGLLIQRETDVHRHLPVRDLLILDEAARVGHFEPAQIAHGLRGLGDGILDGVVHARLRTSG